MLIKKLLPYLIISVLIAPLIAPLFQSGFFQTDDGNWMVIRLSAFHETLKTGQFPVRFLERLNHGYGYPVLNFLYPLPFYLGEIVHLAGFSFIDSVKLLFGASFIFGGLGMFLWAKKWGSLPGVVAALVYSFFLYRISDVYSRGSLGESVAFIFIPLVFLFIDKKIIPLAALSLAALICSHNSLALMFLPLIFLYKPQIKLFILALGLSAFFWLPAFYDLQFTKAFSIKVANYHDYFLTYWPQILEILVPLAVAVIIIRNRALPWVAATLAALFLALPMSSYLWDLLPLPQLVQFPWRLLAIPTFTLAVLAALISQKNKYLGMLIAAVFIIVGLFNLKVDRTFYPDSYYSTNDDTTTVKNEYMPKWVKSNPMTKPPTDFEIVGTKLQINKVYFPGTMVYVNDKSVPIEYETSGLIHIALPKSQANFQFKFEETPLRKFANLLTLITLAVTCAVLITRLRHSSYNKRV